MTVMVQTPRRTRQKLKRSGKRAVPVAIEIRATAPAVSARRRLLRHSASCAKRPSRSIKLIQIKQHTLGAE